MKRLMQIMFLFAFSAGITPVYAEKANTDAVPVDPMNTSVPKPAPKKEVKRKANAIKRSGAIRPMNIMVSTTTAVLQAPAAPKAPASPQAPAAPSVPKVKEMK